MMQPITFFACGVPKGQPRTKARAIKRGDKCFAQVYDPGTADEWKEQVAATARPFIPETPLDVPLRVNLGFYMPRPEKHFNSKGELKSDAPRAFLGKPDSDNLAKAVLDALNPSTSNNYPGMWRDDSLIFILTVFKVYAKKTPGVSVEIKEDVL